MKAHPERVDGVLARKAIRQCMQRSEVWTHYVVACYHATAPGPSRGLAPGCDARDLFAWLDMQPDVPEWCKAKAKQ